MKKKILVVVDMQNDFITGPLGNEECVKVVDPVADLIENGGYDEIITTLDTHYEDYLSTQEGKKLPVKHCVKGTSGHELHDRILCALRGKNSRKVQKCSFGSTRLPDAIRDCIDIDGLHHDSAQIDFCGVCTGICVISNVLMTKAYFPEEQIRVIEHACACVTPESHKIAIEAMKMCQIDII